MTGIYVHIPFCRSKCGYCAFSSRPLKSESELADYFQALHRELGGAASWLSRQRIETLYFGGGTPSIAPPQAAKDLLDAIRTAVGSVSENPEITLEANPETIDAHCLEAFAAAGFNRISLGAQSFDKNALAFLERKHRPKQVEQAVLDARQAGFQNISLDLIIGLPEPHFDAYKADVKRAVWLEPEHLSVYLLTAEEPSRLFEQVKSGTVSLPDSDTQADCFLACHQILTGEGFEHYEVSNYCRSGFQSRHNRAYWDGTPYLGLGAGAHSYIQTGEQTVRRANTSDPDLYMEQLAQDEDPVEFSEIITPMMAVSERLMLELRTAQGVAPADYGEHDEKIKDELTKLLANGWYEWDGGRFRPTAEGFLVADGVAASIVDRLGGQGKV